MFYPVLANFWNAAYQKRMIQSYEQEQSEKASKDEDLLAYEYEKALAYNDTLWPTSEPEDFQFLREEDPLPEYMDCLNINGDGIIGYISIPKINIDIPIFHTTEEESMQVGAGHLEGTSLPIGGKNTHSVIAAHRGLPGHALFTDLDKMEKGDRFYLHILDDTLAYEVDRIVEVNPQDTSKLVIEEGHDYCTLLTCTPYGVNTERLLVRGNRVPYEDGEEDEIQPGMTDRMRWLFIVLIILSIFIIIMVISNKRNKRRTKRLALERSFQNEKVD